MKNLLKFYIAIFLAFISCKSPHEQVEKPVVVTSIVPYQYFVEKIVGNTVDVVSLVPSIANPHIYEPNPQLLQKVSRGALWFKIGEVFEEKIAPSLDIEQVDLSRGMPLIKHTCSCHLHGKTHEENFDTHMWMSPKMCLLQLDVMEQALIEIFPQHHLLYTQNAQSLREELRILDQELEEIFSKATGKAFLVSHPAFAYLCRDYGLKQIPIEQEGKEPTLKQLDAIVNMAKQEKTSLVLTQVQYDNRGANRLAVLLEQKAYLVDPYSANYPETIRKIAYIIASQANPYP